MILRTTIISWGALALTSLAGLAGCGSSGDTGSGGGDTGSGASGTTGGGGPGSGGAGPSAGGGGPGTGGAGVGGAATGTGGGLPEGLVGETCGANTPCEHGLCLSSATFPDGYCAIDCSSAIDSVGEACPDDATCVQVSEAAAYCFENCEQKSDCRDN
jgi:hypothetical protein